MDTSSAAVQQAYAAWIQAIGTLVALAIAVLVPIWQTHRGRKDARQKAGDAVSSIAAIGAEFLNLAKNDLRDFESLRGDERSFWHIEVREAAYNRLIAALENIPLHGLPSSAAVGLVATMTQEASDCRDAFLFACTEVNRLAPIPEHTLSRAKLAVDEIDRIVRKLFSDADDIRRGNG